MEKLKLILATLSTAFCWISLCFNWDLLMYVSGIMALLIIWTLNEGKDKISINEKSEEEK